MNPLVGYHDAAQHKTVPKGKAYIVLPKHLAFR